MFPIFKAPRGRDGMTLIELLISILLITIMLGALWTAYNVGFKVFYSELSRSGIRDELSRAFQYMASELRQATAVTGATATGMTFTSGVSSSGATSTVQYSWTAAGSPIVRTAGSSTKTLVRSAQNAAFTYYNSSNVLLTPPVTASQVKEVAIEVTSVDSGETFTLKTRIDLRNL